MARPLALIVLALGLLLATPARADRAGDGAKAYAAGDWTTAIDAFRDAYRESRDPSLLFNIAQSYYQLGERQEALDYYRIYLERAPEAGNRLEVEARIAELEKPAVPRPAPRPPQPHVVMVDHPLPARTPPPVAPTDNVDALIARRRSLLGGVVRADMDLQTGGAAFAVGASMSFVPLIEVGLTLLVAESPGVQASFTSVLGKRILRPILSLNAPIFFEQGVRVGIGPSAGVRLLLGDHFAIRAEVGVVHFVSAPPTYRQNVGLAILGLEGWL